MICYHATLEVIPRPFCVFYDVEGVTRWIIQCYIPRYAMEARVLLEMCMYFWRIVIISTAKFYNISLKLSIDSPLNYSFKGLYFPK